MKVLILGNGGHARVVADICTLASDCEPVGFLCQGAARNGQTMVGLPVYAESALDQLEYDGLIIAVGDNALRHKIFEASVARGITLATVIHPSAIIARDVVVEPGVTVCAGAIINPGCRIGADSIINTGCTIDHDCIIGPHSHISPGANVAGGVNVGTGALVGLGARVIQGISIGDRARVGAGAVVLHDVAAQTTVVGIPARNI